MGLIVNLDKNGHLVYKGMLSSAEKASVNEVLEAMRAEMPQIETDLYEAYGNSVLYKYYLGLFLGNLLERYSINVSERRLFWDEIKDLVTTEKRVRDDGKNSATRSFFEQCYVLSRYDIETVKRLSWRQWQDILDRVGNREDERIFQWIKQLPGKIREDDWREFEKALNLYLKGKDTSVFDLDELFAIYDSLMMMVQMWRSKFKEFSTEHPKSAKIKTRGTWAKKYYSRCFTLKKECRSKVVSEDICNLAFSEVMGS